MALRDSLGVSGFAQGTPRLRYRERLKSEVGSPKSDLGKPDNTVKAIRRPSVRQVLNRLEIEAAREAARIAEKSNGD